MSCLSSAPVLPLPLVQSALLYCLAASCFPCSPSLSLSASGIDLAPPICAFLSLRLCRFRPHPLLSSLTDPAHFCMQWFLKILFEMCPSLGVCVECFKPTISPSPPSLSPLWQRAVSGVIRKCAAAAAAALSFPGFRFFRQHEFYWLQGQSAHFNLFSTKLWCHSYMNFKFKAIFINL